MTIRLIMSLTLHAFLYNGLKKFTIRSIFSRSEFGNGGVAIYTKNYWNTFVSEIKNIAGQSNEKIFEVYGAELNIKTDTRKLYLF